MKTLKEEKKNLFRKILEKLFKSSNKKFVIKSKCKDSSCCRNSTCIVGYDEKSDHDSSEDIVITDNNVIIK